MKILKLLEIQPYYTTYIVLYAFLTNKMTSKNTLLTSWRPHMRSNCSHQTQNIIATDFILTKENNNLATRMEPRISAGDPDAFYSKSNFTWYASKIDLTAEPTLKPAWSFFAAHFCTSLSCDIPPRIENVRILSDWFILNGYNGFSLTESLFEKESFDLDHPLNKKFDLNLILIWDFGPCILNRSMLYMFHSEYIWI